MPETHIRVYYEGEPYLIPMSFVYKHPDGEELILPYENKDMTEAYDEAGHSAKAMRRLLQYHTTDDGSSAPAAGMDPWPVVGACVAFTSVMTACVIALHLRARY